MTHYASNPGSVRVDRFKESGKWYDTFTIEMDDLWDSQDIHTAVREAIETAGWSANFVDSWLEQGGFFVCLEPYHQYSHPISIKR